MGDFFLTEVNYQGAVLPFEVILINVGYSYRASVMIDDIEVVYKPEEKGHLTLIRDIKRAITQRDMDIMMLIEEQLAAYVKFGNLAIIEA